MKIKRKIFIPIFALAFLAILALIAIADIPPPPANQNFGIYDTYLINYSESLCRGCHNSTSSPLVTGGVPTRHHNLVMNGVINPSTNQPFQCTDCHPTLGGGSGLLLDRNCMDCHNGTAFWADAAYGAKVNITRPHHNTTQAQTRNCKYCHGASVDDYNDGHYIPTYPESEITPNAMYKAWNITSMRVWGGCLACHQQDLSKSPPIYYTGTDSFPPITNGKNNVHHGEIINVDRPPGVSLDSQCLWCHVDVSNVLDIRGCETCHSVRAIHNTQYNYTATNQLIGYGHIGSNNPYDVKNYSWDCKGCHAWYDAGDVNPFAGAIIPDVQTVTPQVFNQNTATVITLTGSNYIQDNSTTVVNIDDQTNLTPDTITNAQITVTVSLPAGNHYIKVVKTDAVENVPKQSGIKPLTVVSTPTISSAKLNKGVVTITGTGFGTKPTTNANLFVSVNHAGNQIASQAINSWTNTQIKATFNKNVISNNDVITAMTADSGEATATIGGQRR